MQAFKKTDRPLTSDAFYGSEPPPKEVKDDKEIVVVNERGGLFKSTSKAPLALPEELKNQFVVFQIADGEGAFTITETSQLEPKIEGTREQPDMYMNLSMQSFHVGESEAVDKSTRATMRLIVGKDKSSRDRLFDNLFWTISAGLDLYNQVEDRPGKPDEFEADFRKAFGRRPIEIPGGLAELTFDVIKHKEPSWWQRTFQFLRTGTGQSLISVVGFPAITNQAIGMLDELFNRLDSSEPEILFKSRPMTLALSQQAKQDFTGGNPRIRLGCLNPGFCVLARGRDFHTIANANAYYYPSYGILAPGEVDPGDVVSGNYDDPFKDVTYVVFYVDMQPTSLGMRSQVQATWA